MDRLRRGVMVLAGALPVLVGTAPRLLLSVGAATETPAVDFDVEAPPAQHLSQHYFFVDAAHQIPNRRVLPYDLNTPHFADYAQLHRFVWLPEHKRIRCEGEDKLVFPVGTVLILTVGYLDDIRDPTSHERIIETRLFVNRRAGWEGLQYIWNDDVSEARLSVTGTSADVSWVHYDGSQRRHRYLAPNRNECNQCHEIDGVVQPLGPIDIGQINRDYRYTDGVENQLGHWTRVGYLTGTPHDPDQAREFPLGMILPPARSRIGRGRTCR